MTTLKDKETQMESLQYNLNTEEIKIQPQCTQLQVKLLLLAVD